ncbi:MAG: class I SAM-dependent methyltransferase [Actinobacteria bacterium]|nr:class I SAM-dependent methyltransferase [Actinomycetota bacterium]
MDARSTTRSGGHAALYDAVMWPAERAAVGAWRRRLAVEARGRVLEIAAGTGAQFRWYAPGTEVTALEPDPGMLGRARRRAAGAAARVAAVQGRAEEVPFPDGSFDAAVSAFGLCTVSDPAAALLELRRVLVSGGALLLLEHVHLAWEPGRTLQRRAAPAWAAVAGGCRLDRDTLSSAREAGFVLVRERTHVAGWIVEATLRNAAGLRAER